MATTDVLRAAFERNARVIRAQADGVSHGEALTRTRYNINTFNWVLGHIVAYRDRVLLLLGEESLLTEAESLRYRRESDPVLEDGPDVIAFPRLLDLFDRGQERISSALAALLDEALEQQSASGERTETLLERLFFLYFHDTYHTGQTELLRQVAGKDDKII
jgi:uncharacterized damage-inducible protein DinB